MPILTCSVANCQRRHSAKGMCNMHYQRFIKHGDVMASKPSHFPEKMPGKCTVDSCEQEVSARGYCIMHYQRWRVSGSVSNPTDVVTCEFCGETVEKKRDAQPRKFCSRECGQKAYWAKNGDQIKADLRSANAAKPMKLHACIRCDEVFESTHAKSKFCSQNCGNKWRDENNAARCTADDCERGVQAKGLCSMHWKRAARAAGQVKSDPWSERRKANHHKRRAQKLQLPADDIRPLDVYERDGWMCGLCPLPVDRTLSYPHPDSSSLDHIIPLSKGGHHTLGNVQLAHLQCNVRKGARVDDLAGFVMA